MPIFGWTCTKCWYGKNGPMRFFCKHCGAPKREPQ